MKNRVNLYSSQYAPTFELISLNSLAATCGLLILFFALSTALLAWQNSSLGGEVRLLQSRVNQLQSSVDTAQQTLATRSPDPKLVAAIESQKLALDQRQRLLGELSMREKVKNNRFSQVLSDLDSADMPSVWLTLVHMSDEKIQLEGYGTQADAMPLWLANLSQTQSFSGTNFQEVNMLNEEQGIFFSLQTELSDSTTLRLEK